MRPFLPGLTAVFLVYCSVLVARGDDGRRATPRIDRPNQPGSSAPHREVPDDPHVPFPGPPPASFISRSGPVVRDAYVSVQVNVDAQGENIPGDAANEPSIAIDPTDPDKIVIGWRQFDNVASNFRQAGWGYSHDGGQTWTFPGVLEPDVFRSDPVLAADADGGIHYYSLTHRDDL